MTITVSRKNPNWVASVLGNVTKLAGKEIACGFPKGKCMAYPEGGEQVADVAARNTFGIGVPQRDFMSYAQPEIIERTGALMKEIAHQASLKGDHAAELSALMEAAGAAGVGAIKSAIVSGDWPPNSPETIARKGEGKKPLIDTSHMVNSTTYVVRDAETR
jgi:hypothetical protein